jgi:hypothetical protein
MSFFHSLSLINFLFIDEFFLLLSCYFEFNTPKFFSFNQMCIMNFGHIKVAIKMFIMCIQNVVWEEKSKTRFKTIIFHQEAQPYLQVA